MLFALAVLRSAHATPAFVQSSYAAPQEPESQVTVTYARAQTAGNLNVVVVGWNDSSASVSSVTDGRGNVYRLATGPVRVSGVASQAIYYAANIAGAGSNSNTVTVRFGSAASYADVRIAEYSGLNTSAPLDAAAGATGNGSNSSSGPAVTRYAGDLVLGANLVQTLTTAAGESYDMRLISYPDGDILEDATVAAAGTVSATAPLSPAGVWIMQTVAFRAAGSVPASGSGSSSDTTPPAVSVTAPASGATISGTVTLSASATDNVAVAKVQFQVDHSNVGSAVTSAPYRYPLNTTTLSSGTHTLTAVATDTSDLTTTSAGVTVTVRNSTGGTSDTTPPTVAITAPASGATVSGTTTVTANGSDNVAVASVQFRVDGNNVGSAVTSAPYRYQLNTATLSNGTHTLTAVATDTSNNRTTSSGVAISVNNGGGGGTVDSTPPTVSITAPTPGSTIFGTVVGGTGVGLAASASDNVAVASVQFHIDGVSAGSTVTASPYAYTWDTTRVANGPHTVTAVAKDAAGNQTTSAGVTVTVSNASAATGAAGPLVAAGTSQPASNYFKPSGTATTVLLSGSHTWNSFQDMGNAGSITPLDFNAYVSFLKTHRMNATILWHKDLPTFCGWGAGGTWTMDSATGMPWLRTTGTAADGQPKFDLTQFNQAYFDRLLARATQLQQNGIYAIVQLFDGLGITSNRCGTTAPTGDGYPFTGVNNVNGIDDGYTSGTSGTGSMTMTAADAITNVQDAYVRKVIDTLNGLPNVLWAISEEAPDNSTWWQNHMIALIRSYEAGKPYQHPIGYPTLNVTGASDSTLFASNADWIAPGVRPSPTDNCGGGMPPCKVDINDSDHTYFGMWNDSAQTNRNYLWENFANGAHVLFMDPYLIYWPTGNRNLCDNNTNPPYGVCTTPDGRWNNFRDNMGYMLVYANTKLDLPKMSADPGLASTGYCLANNVAAGGELLVYAPSGGTFTVNLSAQQGARLRVEWLDPTSGAVTSGGTLAGGSSLQSFTPPWGSSHDAVLYLVDTAGHN